MMGTKQRLKTGLEYDVIYARGVYCYLYNNCKLKKFVKRSLSKRRRVESKKIIMNLEVE